MAITPLEAGTIVEEKYRLSESEMDVADVVEQEIDILVSKIYTGSSATVSIQRPNPRVVRELRRRYERAGWTFLTSDDIQENPRQPGYGQNGYSQVGFSVTLTSNPPKKVNV